MFVGKGAESIWKKVVYPWCLLASSGALGEFILGNEFFPFGAVFPRDVKVALWMWQTCLVVNSLCEIRLADEEEGP